MKILLLVNASPWGGSLAATALRFLRAALAAGHEVPAVYFRGEGVYHALRGRRADPGTEDHWRAWDGLAREHDFDLLLCSAAAARRLPADQADGLEAPWREAGLAEGLGLIGQADRVVSF